MTHEVFKEYSQEIVTVIAIVGGCIAALKAIHEMRLATKQRHQELRWKRAQAAKEVLHDIHSDTRAAAAVMMLDWNDGTHDYTIDDSTTFHISYSDVLTAICADPSSCKSPRDVYIRDCFDWFLYYLDRIEHYIHTNYIDFVDVKSVFKPYARKLIQDISTYNHLIQAREYEGTTAFLGRYHSLLIPSKNISTIPDNRTPKSK